MCSFWQLSYLSAKFSRFWWLPAIFVAHYQFLKLFEDAIGKHHNLSWVIAPLLKHVDYPGIIPPFLGHCDYSSFFLFVNQRFWRFPQHDPLGVPPQDTHWGFRPLGEVMEHQMFSWEDMLSIDILHGDPHDWWIRVSTGDFPLPESTWAKLLSELMIFMVHARDRHQPSNASRSPTLSALASHHFNKYWNRQFYTLNSLTEQTI